MKFEPVVPVLWTDKLSETIAFYVDHLGFMPVAHNPGSEWAALRRDSCELMLSKPVGHVPFNGAQFTGTFYIKTDNVDDLWNRLKDRVKICYGIENFEWGMREFAVYDNNGYIIQFGQDLEA